MPALTAALCALLLLMPPPGGVLGASDIPLDPPPGWTRAQSPPADKALVLEKGVAVFSVQPVTPAVPPEELGPKLAVDARRIGRKRKVTSPVSGETAGNGRFHFASFRSRGVKTHFGYFSLGSTGYSFLARSASDSELRAILGSIGRTAPGRPAPKEGEALPPSPGLMGFLDGRIMLPKTSGWSFERTEAGDLIVSGVDWRFTLSASAVQSLTGTAADDVKTLASAYLAIQETRLVDEEGCRADELMGDQLTNDWKLLYKWYTCPRARAGRRSSVGVLLLRRPPVVAWFGDFTKNEDFDLFRTWLSKGTERLPKDEAAPVPAVRQEPPADEEPPRFILLPILAGAFVAALVFIIGVLMRRRRS